MASDDLSYKPALLVFVLQNKNYFFADVIKT